MVRTIDALGRRGFAWPRRGIVSLRIPSLNAASIFDVSKSSLTVKRREKYGAPHLGLRERKLWGYRQPQIPPHGHIARTTKKPSCIHQLLAASNGTATSSRKGHCANI
jgi:hypothetical protein